MLWQEQWEENFGSSRVKQEALITFKIKNGVLKSSLTTHITTNLLKTKYYYIH